MNKVHISFLSVLAVLLCSCTTSQYLTVENRTSQAIALHEVSLQFGTRLQRILPQERAELAIAYSRLIEIPPLFPVYRSYGIERGGRILLAKRCMRYTLSPEIRRDPLVSST